MTKDKKSTISVQGTVITVLSHKERLYFLNRYGQEF